MVSVVKYPGMHADSFNSQTVSVCCDTVAIRDKKEEKGGLVSALPLSYYLPSGNKFCPMNKVPAVAPEDNCRQAYVIHFLVAGVLV